MDLSAVFGGGAGVGVMILALLSLIQIAPIQLNPWSAIGRAIGKAINSDVLSKIGEVKDTVQATQNQLNEHIRIDDERDADLHRQNILRFNNELLRSIPHTKEDYVEVLAEIDCYEKYCEAHPEYRNNRAVHAVKHIEKTYDERLEKRDFLSCGAAAQ